MEQACKAPQERFINTLIARLEKIGGILNETVTINRESLSRFRGAEVAGESDINKAAEPSGDREIVDRLLDNLAKVSSLLNSQSRDIGGII